MAYDILNQKATPSTPRTPIDIKVEPTVWIDGQYGDDLKAAIALIEQNKFVENLFMDEGIEIMLGLANYMKNTINGTTIFTALDRLNSGMPGESTKRTEIWTADKNRLKAIQYIMKPDTLLEDQFADSWLDRQITNPGLTAFLIAERLRLSYKHMALSLSADIVNLLTGKVTQASDGRKYDGITRLEIEGCGKYQTVKSNILRMHAQFASLIDTFSNKGSRTELGASMKDYIALVSKQFYRTLSYGLGARTSETVHDIKYNDVRVVGGLPVFRSAILGNSFKKNTGNQIRTDDVEYDFSNIHGIVLHKRSYAIILRTLLTTFIDKRKGNFYYTMFGDWGTKDGLIRPQQVGYIVDPT